ncbi:MAG TPA: DNA mismatch repair endonuclease MutL, partial [Spirochaetia bacterium]|nr:DNA mismatch repair endonuclease MutL [Spirochaetia bacterium]
ATSIEVHIEAGGVSSIRVIDNGVGMPRGDLELCWHSHATSKIESVEDLDSLSSLGFRGEALSSVAACSRLTITSRTAEDLTAHRLRVESGKLLSLSESPGERGTLVEVADLFYSLPARRKFLKTPSAETARCRSLFIEKAIAFPSIEFRLFTGGEMKLFLPAAATLSERILAAHPSIVNPDIIHRVEARSERFSLSMVMGGPSLYRKDRRYIWTYVNNRKISDFSLIQAVEYGFGDHIPGGTHPVAFVFISIDPDLVDFNVHPAKREARFRNLPEIHHALVVAIKDYLKSFTASYARPQDVPFREGPEIDLYADEGPLQNGTGQPYRRPGDNLQSPRRVTPLPESIARLSGELAPLPAPTRSDSIRYFGQVFDLFLLASVGDRLFIIDQHAAHERILFDRLREDPGKPQNLLVPIPFEVTEDEERGVEGNIEVCRELGINLRRGAPGQWEVLSLPEGYSSLGDELVDFVKQARGTRRELEQELYARMSCRAAVKEGDSIDEITAVELIRQAFELEHARCPHGRPIWYELSRTELYHLVGRL